MRSWLNKVRNRYPAVEVAVAMFEKGGQDNVSRLAAVISYYSFFSLFPLLLVLVWAADTLLTGSLRQDVIDSALSRFPVIGKNISVGTLGGGLQALVVGIAAALWAGTKAFEGFEQAMHTIWHGPLVKPESFVKRKARAVVMIFVFGVGLLVASAGAAVVTAVDQIPGAARPAGFVAAIVFNTLLVGAMFWFALPERPPFRHLVPGAVAAGIGMTLLNAVGTFYLTRVVQGASDTYGVFAVVIGLLTWLNLIATVVVWSGEFNSVLAGRRATEEIASSR